MKMFSLLYMICFATIINIAQAETLHHSFKLLISLYNEKNACRCAEYIACLEKNLQHHLIGEIHVLYDVSSDDKDNALFNYLKTQHVTISLIKERATYGDFFKIANECYPNSRVIVANADIYFNETLDLLENYDLTNKFLALTRWNVRKDGTLKKNSHEIGGINFNHKGSQDVWIFSTPIRKFKKDSIKIGFMGCDNVIAYYALEAGLKVLNPCLSIQCCHLHNSGIRNYDKKSRVYIDESGLKIGWTQL